MTLIEVDPFVAIRDQALVNAVDADYLQLVQLARAAAMSERTLARRFREETGESPLAWLTAPRLAAARDLLERTNLSMEHIADKTGMGTATNLRLHFTSNVGVPPNLYRKQFRRAEA